METPEKKGERERVRKNIWRNNGRKISKNDKIYEVIHLKI